MVIGKMEVIGVPEGHEICLIIDIGGGDFFVFHREKTNSSLEIKTGSLKALHNGISIMHQLISHNGNGRIIMTKKNMKRYGALDIPLPKNYKDIKNGITTRPIYRDENGPTFLERPVKIPYYSQNF